MIKLTIEMVPKSSWYTNVRSNVSRTMWNFIRKKCYHNANNKCEICDSSKSIECHEIWEYDDELLTQTLIGLICLCNDCHTVKHAGLAKLKGKEELVIKQIMKINNWNRNETIAYIEQSFRIWRSRSKHIYKVNFSFIDSY
jgi:hypothetical protein